MNNQKVELARKILMVARELVGKDEAPAGFAEDVKMAVKALGYKATFDNVVAELEEKYGKDAEDFLGEFDDGYTTGPFDGSYHLKNIMPFSVATVGLGLKWSGERADYYSYTAKFLSKDPDGLDLTVILETERQYVEATIMVEDLHDFLTSKELKLKGRNLHSQLEKGIKDFYGKAKKEHEHHLEMVNRIDRDLGPDGDI